MAEPASTARQDEVARFSALAETWWDPEGPMKPLHRMNPARMALLHGFLCDHFGRDPRALRPFAGLTMLDIGCGAGLLTEPMARLGFAVTGLDASEENVRVARLHAGQEGLDVAYHPGGPENLARQGRTFDAVLNMEVIEHVEDPDAFLGECAALVRPGGVMALATLNRTWKSLAAAKIGAEYVLNWLPRGTHDWRRFLKPSELAGVCRRRGLTVLDTRGLTYQPLRDAWQVSRDLSVNYVLFAGKPG